MAIAIFNLIFSIQPVNCFKFVYIMRSITNTIAQWVIYDPTTNFVAFTSNCTKIVFLCLADPICLYLTKKEFFSIDKHVLGSPGLIYMHKIKFQISSHLQKWFIQPRLKCLYHLWDLYRIWTSTNKVSS